MAPLLLYLCRRGFGWFAVIVVLASLLAYRLRFSEHWALLPVKGQFFLTGIASFYLWKWKDQIRIPAGAWSYVVTFATMIVYLSTWSVPLLIWTLVLLSAMAASLGSSGAEATVASLLRWQPLKYIHLAANALNHVTGITQLTYFSLLVAAVVTLTIVVSHFLYKWVEAPGIEWGRRLANG